METIDKEEASEKKSVFLKMLGGFIVLVVILLLGAYFFLPNGSMNSTFNSNTNFSINDSSDMQFYENMRFPGKNISYSIDDDCTIAKRGQMIWAFDILENLTVLNFYESSPSQIRVSCDEKNRMSDDGLFIAGEGGPTNISMGKIYKVIGGGQILLIRDSTCERPNIAIHELLHVLGFKHSQNPNNIMYPVSKCKQVIGEDTIDKINELYSVDELPDLQFEKVSADIKSRLLNLEMVIRNEGLKSSGSFDVYIYSGDKKIKKISFEEGLPIGGGSSISIENLVVPTIKIDSLRVVIKGGFPEIDKKNNEIILDFSK